MKTNDPTSKKHHLPIRMYAHSPPQGVSASQYYIQMMINGRNKKHEQKPKIGTASLRHPSRCMIRQKYANPFLSVLSSFLPCPKRRSVQILYVRDLTNRFSSIWLLWREVEVAQIINTRKWFLVAPSTSFAELRVDPV